MQTILTLSVLLNIILVSAIWLTWRRARYSERSCLAFKKHHYQEMSDAKIAVEKSSAEYQAFARAVGNCIKEVSKDIGRNYYHVHDGHVLHRLAYAFQREGGPVRLDSSLESDIRDADGGEHISDGFMLFSGALAFAWHIHEQARRGAGQLFEVVQESCGMTNRGAWLSKTLALYERICDQNKDEAIRSLSLVLEHWKYMDVGDSIR